MHAYPRKTVEKQLKIQTTVASAAPAVIVKPEATTTQNNQEETKQGTRK